ncbi:MAG: hypothetical protein ACI4NL_00725 [Christensenellales bacterium]
MLVKLSFRVLKKVRKKKAFNSEQVERIVGARFKEEVIEYLLSKEFIACTDETPNPFVQDFKITLAGLEAYESHVDIWADKRLARKGYHVAWWGALTGTIALSIDLVRLFRDMF